MGVGNQEMDDSQIPTDGPEIVLGQLARRLGLRYSRTHVARSVARHPRPSSLLALVEVAGGLGISVTAGRADVSALEDVDLPAVVHFNGTQGGGFGVLEGVAPDAFKVWDGSRGAHLVARRDFLERWSGVIGLVERAEERGEPEKAYLRNRLTEVVFSGYEPPAIVGHKAATVLRALLAVLTVALLVLGVSSFPTGDRGAVAAIAVLSLCGLGVTILTGVSIGAQDSALSDRICARGRFVDCHSVLGSRYSRIFGVPFSDIGISFFGSIVLLMTAAALVADPTNLAAAVALVYAASIPLSLALIGVQIGMRQLCTLCIAVHSVNLSSAAIAWFWLRPRGWALGDIVAPTLLLALHFFLLLFLVIPYFKKNQGLRIVAAKHLRISRSPFAALAEILTEKPTAVIADRHAVALDGPGGEHELVLFAHPSCGKCDAAIGDVRALAAAGLISAYMGLAPKDPDESDRRACSAVTAAALVLGPERAVEAYGAAKRRLREMMTEDPVAIISEETSISESQVRGFAHEAREILDRAERFVDEHAEGTPAVFFNSRLYRGELGHLAWLLQRHPDLLADTRLPREGDPDHKLRGVESV